MYAPPQYTQAAPQPSFGDHHKLSTGLLTHIRHHSHQEPFSYEYIFEEGRLPALAEFHPKSREHQATKTVPSKPYVQPASNMRRSKSLKRTEKPVQLENSQAPPQERTSDKLKRAFSLSGMRSSHSRRAASQSHIKDAPPVPRRPLNHIAPPAPESRVPSLVLPTPSPSPEPIIRNSFNSNRKAHINYSLPRSSWASFEDDFDLVFLRESAVGRLSPSPLPTTELRRDKALALLGITDMPISPPYTPAPSTAPSVRDYHSRASSRRPSMENRRSQHIPPPVDVKKQPNISTPAEQETPKPAKQEQQQTSPEQATPIATPRPQVLRRKTSKFIEHLDSHAEKLSNPAPTPRVVVTEPKRTVERSSTVPILRAPQPRSSSPVRRSISMKTPSPNPSTWGVVCTAQARPIVAAGHAKMIQS